MRSYSWVRSIEDHLEHFHGFLQQYFPDLAYQMKYLSAEVFEMSIFLVYLTFSVVLLPPSENVLGLQSR